MGCGRGKRRAATERVVARRKAQARTFIHEHDPGSAVVQMGLVMRPKRRGFRDRSPLDCGQPQCGVCHPGKFVGERSPRDRREMQMEE